MIDYWKTKPGDILRVVQESDGYANVGDYVKVTAIGADPRVIAQAVKGKPLYSGYVQVIDPRGRKATYHNSCGAHYLEPTEWKGEFPSKED